MRGFVPRGLGGCFFAWVGVIFDWLHYISGHKWF